MRALEVEVASDWMGPSGWEVRWTVLYLEGRRRETTAADNTHNPLITCAYEAGFHRDSIGQHIGSAF